MFIIPFSAHTIHRNILSTDRFPNMNRVGFFMKTFIGILIFLAVLFALSVTFALYCCMVVAGREDEYMENITKENIKKRVQKPENDISR